MHQNRSHHVQAIGIAVSLIVFGVLWPTQVALHAQGQQANPRKFDQFEDLRADDQQARLDNFATQLRWLSEAQGFIVSYRGIGLMPGSRLREVYGFQDYLVNRLGVDARRLTVVNAGVKQHNLTQLWLAPAGASPPAAEELASLNDPIHFDSLPLGDECISEYTLVLETPDDALKLFAEALRDAPAAQGLVLVHPASRGAFSRGQALATNSQRNLTGKYHISNARFTTLVEPPRHCAELNFWLLPADFVVPTSASVTLFFMSRLMAEAEREHYAVRRIELVGNTYTRDNTIRRRLLQNEGDTFRRSLLEQSLRSVSKLRQLHPVAIDDVEVSLNKHENN